MIRGLVAAVTAGVLAAVGLAAPARADRASGTVRGTYSTHDGRPIAGATVYSDSPQSNGASRVGTTDALGRYVLVDVPAGPVTLSFRADGIAQWAPGKLDPDDAARYTVLAGLTLTVDERQLPTGTVAGRFTTPAGAPVANASVNVQTTADVIGRSLKSVRTDADGRYTLTGIPVGPVKVEFHSGRFQQYANGAADFASGRTYRVVAGETLVVDETQLATGTITGRLTDAAGAPVPTFSAAASRVGGTPTYIWESSTAGGRYTLTVPAGQWRVRFSAGYPTGQWAPGRAVQSEGQVFTVAAGETVEVDDVLLPTGSIRGTLRRANGRPIADRTVQLWRDGEQVASVFTDEGGEYVFETVLTGDYRIAYTDDYFLPGTVRPERAAVFTVRAGETTVADGTAPEPGTVTGTLLLPDGRPAVGMTVEARAVTGVSSLNRSAITEPDGSWRLIDVYPEDYRLSYADSRRAFRQDGAAITVAPGETVDVDDTWRSGAAVTVRAVDAATGEPVSDFCVSTSDWYQDYCTPGSEVTVAGRAAGATTLTVTPARSSDYVASADVPVTVADGEEKTVTVPLTLGGRVNTQVVDRATGEPVENACILLVAPGTGGITEPALDCTNKQGKVTTRAKPAGPYQIFVKAPYGYGAQWMTTAGGTGDQRQATRFTVKAGKTVKAGQVLLDPAGTVTGVVRDPSGAPVPSVNVDVTAWDIGAGPPYPSVATDSQGRYTLRTLGPYAWPLLFTPLDTFPRQWSGGVANRFQAQTVTVPAEGSVTYDTTLTAGSTLTGTVTVAGGERAWDGGRLTAVNAATGDQLAIAEFPGAGGTYATPVIGGNPVKLAWYLVSPAASARGWWENAADMETATRVNVPRAGVRRLDLTVG